MLLAIRWLVESSTTKAFAPEDLRGALAFLGTSVDRVVITSELDVLHNALQAKALRSARAQG